MTSEIPKKGSPGYLSTLLRKSPQFKRRESKSNPTRPCSWVSPQYDSIMSPRLSPGAFFNKLPARWKWTIWLGSILSTLIGWIAVAYFGLQAYIDQRVDARMRDGAFKKELVDDLNRRMAVNLDGAVVRDPSRMFGSLVTEVSVTLSKVENTSRPIYYTTVRFKLDRFVDFTPRVEWVEAFGQVIYVKRLAGTEWEARLSGPLLFSEMGEVGDLATNSLLFIEVIP